MLFPPKRS